MSARPPSLQRRLLVPLLVVLLAVWLAAIAAIWIDARHELDELLDGHLAQAAALLVAQQSRAGDGEGGDLDAPVLHRYAPAVMFQVFHEGRLTLRSANAPATPLPAPRINGFASVSVDGQPWRLFAARGAERDLLVVVGEQAGSRRAILWAVARGAMWPLLAALPLLALAAWWAIARGVAPMRRLGQAIGARQPQALEPIVVDGITADLLPVVDAINRLFDRIGDLLDSERRFTADAAHELRTPIAAIRTQAQVARHEADPALRQHALDATVAGCDRATRVVEQLLTLARLEAGSAPPLAPLDLAQLAQTVLAELAAKAIAAGQALEFDGAGAGACLVNANETLAAILLRNLVDNAIAYCPRGSRVRVRVRRRAGQVLLEVDDSGPALAPAALARLGERFFREAGSAASGSGLGWSIVRRIAAVHGWQVTPARSAELHGLAVQLCCAALPAV